MSERYDPTTLTWDERHIWAAAYGAAFAMNIVERRLRSLSDSDEEFSHESIRTADLAVTTLRNHQAKAVTK